MGCECCPYGSQGILVTAQVLMGITFFVSFAGWYLTWVCGLIAWVLLLILACAKVHRAVLITSAVFAMIAAIGQFILAGLAKTLNVYCDSSSGTSSNYYTGYDDDYSSGYRQRHYHYYTSSNNDSNSCHNTITTIRAIAIVTGIGWVISSILVIYLSVALKDKMDRTQSAWARPGDGGAPNKHVPPGGAAASGTVTTETTQLPDGSTKIKETRVNADGSQTITERIVTTAGVPITATPSPTVVTPIITVEAEDVEKQSY